MCLKKTVSYRTYVLKLAYNITSTLKFIISYSSVMSLLYYHIIYNYAFMSHFPCARLDMNASILC